MSDHDDTYIGNTPFFAPGQYGKPKDTVMILRRAGPAVEQCAALTGKEKFEHMLLYCLTLLDRAKSGDICAFYIKDFDDCDQYTLRVVQTLITRSGYVTRDFHPDPYEDYEGFWAWKPE